MLKRMMRIFLLAGFALVKASPAGAQEFKTLVPQAPVYAQESFSIQYIMADDSADRFIVPEFGKIRLTLVSGPAIYYSLAPTVGGTRTKNVTYTVVAPSPGRYRIPGATLLHNGKKIKSNAVEIEVSTRPGTRPRSGPPNPDYYLRPGEDPQKKIRKNLFVRVQTDRAQCYVGQPLVATFKLYSRLETKSDIIKNPGFYGFTVVDLVNLDDHVSRVEIVNGKSFVVHTIRVVQLYPLRPGNYSIDPMEIANRVEFSHSPSDKQLQQEIREGLHEENLVSSPSDTDVFEHTISTDRVSIQVKPLPDRNQPAGFTGAIGRFSIQPFISPQPLRQNGQGMLEIVIHGRGNFTQLPAPEISWPAGIEHFDPGITDSLDRKQTPLAGKRVFRFPFVASRTGTFEIPPVSFSYFDPDSNRYRTLTTSAIAVAVIAAEVPAGQTTPSSFSNSGSMPGPFLWSLVAFVLLLIPGFWIFLRSKNRQPQPRPVPDPDPVPVSVNQRLQSARESLAAGDGQFYARLQRVIWEAVSEKQKWAGGEISKEELRRLLKESDLGDSRIAELAAILRHCETAVFSGVKWDDDKQGLLERTAKTLSDLGF